MQHVSPKYRPDIDGLRALAVILVLAFHGFPHVVSGGYIGVDVFFVISGFLIGSIVISEIESNTFSIFRFYARRVRRIFPALLTVLVCAFVGAWILLLPDELRTFAGHLLYSTLFAANISFWQASGYFAPDSDTVPLLHLWSLGIEEQFYAFWPLAAMCIVPLGRRLSIFAALAALIVSLAASLISIRLHPSEAFYLPQFRAWELLSGVVLASSIQWFPNSASFVNRPPWQATALAALGVFMILAAALLFSKADVYPTWRALVPVTGAMLVIAAGASSSLNRLVLAHPFAVAVGLISYPLYLWHWPLLVYGNLIQLTSTGAKLGLLALSIALASITYFVIEHPARRAKLIVCRSLLIAMGTIGLTSAFVYKQYFASGTPEMREIVAARSDWVSPQGRLPVIRDGYSEFWSMGEDATVFMLGDSNMEQYYPRVKHIAENGHRSAIFAVRGGCPPVPQTNPPNDPLCSAFVRDAYAYALHTPKIETVVIGAHWLGYYTSSSLNFDDGTRQVLLTTQAGQDLSFQALATELAQLVHAGKRVYLLLNIPVGSEYDPMARVRRSQWGVPFVVSANPPSKDNLLIYYGAIRERLAKLARAVGVQLIDPLEFLCDKTTCAAVDETGRPIYKDGAHLRAEYVRDRLTYLDAIFSDSH